MSSELTITCNWPNYKIRLDFLGKTPKDSMIKKNHVIYRELLDKQYDVFKMELDISPT